MMGGFESLFVVDFGIELFLGWCAIVGAAMLWWKWGERDD